MAHLGNRINFMWWEREVQGKQPLGSGEAGGIGLAISYQRAWFLIKGEAVVRFMFQE